MYYFYFYKMVWGGWKKIANFGKGLWNGVKKVVSKVAPIAGSIAKSIAPMLPGKFGAIAGGIGAGADMLGGLFGAKGGGDEQEQEEEAPQQLPSPPKRQAITYDEPDNRYINKQRSFGSRDDYGGHERGYGHGGYGGEGHQQYGGRQKHGGGKQQRQRRVIEYDE
jgi:hypothetical protein